MDMRLNSFNLAREFVPETTDSSKIISEAKKIMDFIKGK
jgi:hypothetical protein